MPRHHWLRRSGISSMIQVARIVSLAPRVVGSRWSSAGRRWCGDSRRFTRGWYRDESSVSALLLAPFAVGLAPLQPTDRPRRIAPAGGAGSAEARPAAAARIADARRPRLPHTSAAAAPPP